MMPTTATVSWLFLVFATLQSISTIQIVPETEINRNKTTQAQHIDYSSNETIIADSELSASERNRRLIPYMAFYLPPPELPINQKYLLQRPRQSQQQTSIKAQQYAEHAVPQGTSGAIPIPTAYVHMKVPAAATGADLQYHQQHQQQQQYFPPSAGEVYHSIAYGGQHPIPISLKDNSKKPPAPHTTGLGHTVPVTGAETATHYKEIDGNDHKSILVYQPSAVTHQQRHHQQHQQQQLPLQQQYPRQRPKQSKFNLTPFTSSNTVPGHFIPIIYTPLSVTTNDDAANQRYNSNNQELSDEKQEQQHQQHRQQKQQQQSHEIVHHSAEYPLPAAASSGQSMHPRPPQQVQFLTVTAAPPTADTATHPTSRPIYHVFNEPSESLLSQSSPSSQQQQEQLQHQHQYQQQHHQLLIQQPQPLPPQSSILKQNHQHYTHSHTATHLKHSQFHPPKPENFFDTEQYQNAGNMTPQQKYVQYLQQRLHYNKQQKQQRSKDRQRERQQNYKQQFRLQQLPVQQQQYQGEQQPAQIFVISSTVSPVESSGGGNEGGQLIEIQHSSQLQQQQQQQLNYPPYDGVGHRVYQSSKFTVPTNQSPPHTQSQPQQHQQVLHIPVHRPVSVSELESQQQHHPGTQIDLKQHRPQLVEQYEKIPPSVVPPQYIDYLFEEPKQSLDDEHPQHRQPQHPPATSHPTHRPPQAAYIVITTASPHSAEPPTRQHYITTPRPIYKNQPTLRLQPIKSHAQHPTRAPSISEHSIPPKYIYVTKKPDYNSPPSSAPLPIRNHKPSFDYEEYNDAKPTKDPSTPAGTVAITKPVENYQPEPHVMVDYQQQPFETAPPQSTTQHHQQQKQHLADPNQLPDIHSSSLAEILHKLQASNHLPQTLTPDNIDNSIKTLITILNNLKQSQTVVANPPQHHEKPNQAAEPDYDYTTGSEEENGNAHPQDSNVLSPVGPTKRPGPNTGRPGVDYPNYADIPATSFDCSQQRYKGFFGDPETNCQVWHYCDLNGGKASFLCPNGTIFSQIALTCDWWFNVKCSTTSQLYVLNERLYKYILPFTPKFPEDYSGPIVDKYLALKFQEMEEKMRLEKQKEAVEAQEPSNSTDAEVVTTTMSSAHEHHSINSLVGEQSSERNLLIDDEVDDISQRGSVDTFDSTTPTTSTTREAEIPLSLKPIVVSSTAEPEEQDFREQNAQESQETYENKNQIRPKQHPLMEQQKLPPRETTKISVEKVEVIEIKSDGSSGHLTPEMIFNSDDTKR